MPNKAKGRHKSTRLTAKKVRELSRPGFHSDGGCLYLRIAPGGSKQWVARLTVRRNRCDMSLGSVDLVSLSEARKKAKDYRRIAWAGGDPRQPKGVPTFQECAEQLHKTLQPTWKNAKHAAQWLSSLETYAYGTLAKMPVNMIRPCDVLRVLGVETSGETKAKANGLWVAKNETARRVRSRIRSTLNLAQSQGHIPMNMQNPAGEILDPSLTKRDKSTQRHMDALPHKEVSDFLRALDKTGASDAVKLLARFQALTATRPSEARLATWGEIDLDKKVWEIPPERMKMGLPHRVPLSAATLAVLEKAKALRKQSGLLFPSPLQPTEPLSNMALNNRFKKMKWHRHHVPHGMRSSFRDWAEENEFHDHACEQALAHAVKGVRGSYLRTTVFKMRVPLMESWGEYLTTE